MSSFSSFHYHGCHKLQYFKFPDFSTFSRLLLNVFPAVKKKKQNTFMKNKSLFHKNFAKKKKKKRK